MHDDLTMLSAAELLHGYRRRLFSPVEVTSAVLARIDARDHSLNAFRMLDADGAMAAARASERRWRKGIPAGLVDGVPATVKASLAVASWSTQSGSRTAATESVLADAPAVARLRDAGAVLLGTTEMPEFAWKGVGPRGSRTPRNPWNADLTPGGSSSGAAVACATGMGALHLGTDGGGSIRIPSGFCGVFGMKPTFGRVAAYPPSIYGTLAHVGPMTRTVADGALMLTVIAAPDSRDWTALPPSAIDYRTVLTAGVAGLRIAFSPNLGFVEVDRDVARLVADAAAVFADLGAAVEECDPGFADPIAIFDTLWCAAGAWAVDSVQGTDRSAMDPSLLAAAAFGREISVADVMNAEMARGALARTMAVFHQKYDLLLTPTLPIPAFPIGRDTPTGHGNWTDWAPFSYPFNLTQQPACSLPCGLTPTRLPVGLQIVGAKYADALVLRAAAAFESVRSYALDLHA